MSAHFANTVYVATNATLRAGGGLEASTLPSFSGSDWYGYAMDGCEDLDGDGSLDLVAGGRAGGSSTCTWRRSGTEGAPAPSGRRRPPTGSLRSVLRTAR